MLILSTYTYGRWQDLERMGVPNCCYLDHEGRDQKVVSDLPTNGSSVRPIGVICKSLKDAGTQFNIETLTALKPYLYRKVIKKPKPINIMTWTSWYIGYILSTSAWATLLNMFM